MKKSQPLSLSALVLLALVGFIGVVKALTVHDVCVKSIYPQACLQILNSDPRHTTTDLVVIAHIAIDKGLSSVASTDKKIKSLLAQTKDPLLKRDLNKCLSLFDLALFNLGRAYDLIRTRDFEGLNGVGAMVTTSGVDCHASLGRNMFKDETAEATVIGEVIDVISNLF